MTKVIERKTYLRPEEEAQSKNVPENFYQSHTGYDPNDKRDMAKLEFKPTPEIVSDTEQRANNTIVTPRGRQISADNFSLRSIVPEVFDKMEKRENERAALAEKRMKGRQAGMLISDALKTLVDVYGQNKGAYNTRRAPERIDFSELDKLDADHSAALQKIRKAKMDDALAAAREAGRDIDRGIRAQEEERKKKQGDDKLEFEKYKFPIVQKDKKDEGEANRQSREKIAKMRKPTTRVQTPKKEEGSDATYNYSVPLNYRNSPNYNRLNPDQEGSVNIKGVHVARYANDFVNNYPQKMAELKDKRMKLDPNSPTWASENAAIKAEESRLTNIYDIAKRLATGGGKWNEADVTTILDETMRPDNYLELINQTPTSIQSEPLPTPRNPVIDFVNKAFNGQRVNVTPNQTATPPAKPTAQSTPSVSYQFSTPELKLKDTDPKRIKATSELLDNDYVDFYGNKPKMQDKFMLHAGSLMKAYTKEYPLTNTSPLAKRSREKVESQLADQILKYWANLGDDTIEKMQAIAEMKGVTIEELILPIAKGVAEGTTDMNDIF